MIQLTKIIFLSALSVMKAELDLFEFKLGKKSDEFKYVKKRVMDFTYKGLKELFKTLSDEKIIVRCPNKCKLRQGYKDCSCGGSGWTNKENK